MRPAPIVANTHDYNTHHMWVNIGGYANAWQNYNLRVIATTEQGWDHVSVSLENRTPTWAEMEFVKRCFFFPQETVVQYHVPESEHINHHPYCLHLWRPQGFMVPRPPNHMVGAPT